MQWNREVVQQAVVRIRFQLRHDLFGGLLLVIRKQVIEQREAV